MVSQQQQAILLGADPGYMSRDSEKSQMSKKSAYTILPSAYKKEECLQDEDQKKMDEF